MNLAGGFGIGAELSVKLFDLGSGGVAANVMPFFLAGERGNFAALPVGVAYHFQ